jgi:hypothetical protein
MEKGWSIAEWIYLCSVLRKKIRITFKSRERKKIMMLTMFSLAVEVFAAAQAVYICKKANKIEK